MTEQQQSHYGSKAEFETCLQEKFPEAHHRFRLAYLAIAREAPDEMADRLREIFKEDPERAWKIMEAVKNGSVSAEPLVSYAQQRDVDDSPEERRSPLPHEPQRINPEKILVLSKRSKVELDQQRNGKSLKEIEQRYIEEAGPEQAERIMLSHWRQQEAKTVLAKLVPPEQWHFFWDIDEEERIQLLQKSDFEMIFAFGGDDTGKAIAPYMRDKYFMMLNSDCQGSVGANTSHTLEQYGAVYEALLKGEFLIEEWARLAVEIEIPRGNGRAKIIPANPAFNEVGIMDARGNRTFRGQLHLEGKKPFSVKGTGVTITTGAGSTGWYNSSTPDLFVAGRRYPRSTRRAEFIIRERYRFGSSLEELLERDPAEIATTPGVIKDGEVLEIVSSSNNNPMITIDCSKDYPFPRGAKARIRIADSGLKIVHAIL